MHTSLLAATLQEAAPDTAVVVAAQGTLDTIHTVAVIFLALTVLALLLLFLGFALKLRKMESDVRRLLRTAEKGLDPVMMRLHSISENVDFVSHVVRDDVERLADTVDGMRRRLERTSDRMEQRVEEFNALMEVVQSEAEEIFVDTASTVRGVRAGSRRFADRGDEDADGES